MAYKRITSKTGKNSRSTTTYNTNGTHTQSSSMGGKGTTRTTVSYNSKTGAKITKTNIDGNGYVHRKTIFSTAGAARESRKSKKQDAEVGKAIIRFFSGDKKSSVRNKNDESSLLGRLIVLGILICGAYVILN